jgi:hypothetical protein
MTELMPTSWYQRRRPRRPRFPPGVHLFVSIGLLFFGLLFTVSSVPEFQASIGDGTLGTYTVTGFTDDPHHDVLGTFISANRQVVVKNRAYIGNPPLHVGTTVPAIIPSWGWLRSVGSAYGSGRNPTVLPLLVFSGVLALAAVASLTWSIRRLRRARRARRTFPIATTRST